MSDRPTHRLLSDRQAEIIRSISRKLGNRVIAQDLGIDYRTVRHVRRCTGAYAFDFADAEDNPKVEENLRRRFPHLVD